MGGRRSFSLACTKLSISEMNEAESIKQQSKVNNLFSGFVFVPEQTTYYKVV